MPQPRSPRCQPPDPDPGGPGGSGRLQPGRPAPGLRRRQPSCSRRWRKPSSPSHADRGLGSRCCSPGHGGGQPPGPVQRPALQGGARAPQPAGDDQPDRGGSKRRSRPGGSGSQLRRRRAGPGAGGRSAQRGHAPAPGRHRCCPVPGIWPGADGAGEGRLRRPRHGLLPGGGPGLRSGAEIHPPHLQPRGCG